MTQSQTPEAQRALQAFALRAVAAKATAEGVPYLEYTMENGLRFASGFSIDELRALALSIDEVLGRHAKA